MTDSRVIYWAGFGYRGEKTIGGWRNKFIMRSSIIVIFMK
jgi:hypothetical protein